jgi:hypothetical protein
LAELFTVKVASTCDVAAVNAIILAMFNNEVMNTGSSASDARFVGQIDSA